MCAGPAASQVAAQPDSTTQELLTDAAGTALPGAAEAPALWAAMRPPAHMHSPFSSPAIQMLPAGIADAAQLLMNGGSATVDLTPASASTPNAAASQAQTQGLSHSADQSTNNGPVPLRTETVKPDTAGVEKKLESDVNGAAQGPADACVSAAQQPEARISHKDALVAAAETSSPNVAASEDETGVDVPVETKGQVEALRKLALLQQMNRMNSSFSIPETPSLGDELRGDFKLPQHLDNLKVSAIQA